MVSKIKPVIPSLREKKRYIVFEVLSEHDIKDIRLVQNAIVEAGLKFIGQLGMAGAGVIMVKTKWNSKLRKGILRVNHRYVDQMKASFTMINKIDGKDVIVRSVGVSGILKKAEDKFLKIAS